MMTLYVVLLTLHNLNRWLVLGAGLWTLVQSAPGRGPGTSPSLTLRRSLTIFTASVHLQLLLGLMLFAFMGMQKIPVFAGAPRPSFQWEHLFLGLLVAITATLGSILSKRAPDAQRQRRAIFNWTALSLLLSLLLIPWWRPLLRLFNM